MTSTHNEYSDINDYICDLFIQQNIKLIENDKNIETDNNYIKIKCSLNDKEKLRNIIKPYYDCLSNFEKNKIANIKEIINNESFINNKDLIIDTYKLCYKLINDEYENIQEIHKLSEILKTILSQNKDIDLLEPSLDSDSDSEESDFMLDDKDIEEQLSMINDDLKPDLSSSSNLKEVKPKAKAKAKAKAIIKNDDEDNNENENIAKAKSKPKAKAKAKTIAKDKEANKEEDKEDKDDNVDKLNDDIPKPKAKSRAKAKTSEEINEETETKPKSRAKAKAKASS